jgi:hypothetical protein
MGVVWAKGHRRRHVSHGNSDRAEYYSVTRNRLPKSSTLGSVHPMTGVLFIVIISHLDMS